MMPHLPEDEDARLKVLFRAAVKPVSDEGFSDRVAQRVAHAAARRRIVLGVAGVVGFAIAAQPLWNLVSGFSGALVAGADRFATLGNWFANPLVLAAAALILVAPSALRWLEE
jgi:hypothetical protein